MPAHTPALAPFETLDAALAALALSSPLAREPREALIAALVAGAQRTREPLFASLLLAAFAPMLLRLRGRLGGSSDDDLDQCVMTAFLGAVREVSPGPHAAIALRWATEKRVFAELRAMGRSPRAEPFDEETHRGAHRARSPLAVRAPLSRAAAGAREAAHAPHAPRGVRSTHSASPRS